MFSEGGTSREQSIGEAMEITIEVSDQYLADYHPDEIARRIKLYAAVLMFQSEELSAGAASRARRRRPLHLCRRHVGSMAYRW